MKAQQAEREARDAFPSLYAVASSLAGASSSIPVSCSGSLPGKASRDKLSSGLVSARRPLSAGSRTNSYLSNDPYTVSTSADAAPASSAFRYRLQATSRSSSTDSFVSRASRLGLKEEDMRSVDDADAGTDSDCMEVEERLTSTVRLGPTSHFACKADPVL